MKILHLLTIMSFKTCFFFFFPPYNESQRSLGGLGWIGPQCSEFNFFGWPILLRQKGKRVDKAPLWIIMNKFILTFINHYKQFQIGQSALLTYSTWCVFWKKCQFYLPLCFPAACVWLATIYFVCLHLKRKSHKKEKNMFSVSSWQTLGTTVFPMKAIRDPLQAYNVSMSIL